MKIDNYFKKIYVINLFDKKERWEKVSKQFRYRKINIERFIAIDGRCSSQGKKGCLEKLKSFEIMYNVKINIKKSDNIKVMIPAASLTIGTILILRNMVKEKYPRILICEDDIELSRNFENKFNQGIKELILYLGCGDKCGSKGVSYEKSKKFNSSLLNQIIGEESIYVSHPNDIRIPCDHCNTLTEHISKSLHPGGTWCYAVSLKGAKKILKLIDNDAGNHIDQILAKEVESGNLIAYAFDPPIVMHESIIGKDGKRNTDIPWEW